MMQITKILLFALIIITLGNCSKDEIEIEKTILGEWISIDKSDTLNFTTKNDFYKSNGYMHYDHYDYQLYTYCIEIGYKGKMYVLIEPTKHEYQLNNTSLTIDFNNRQCYGFGMEKTTYVKQQ